MERDGGVNHDKRRNDYFNSHAHVERDDKIMFALEDVKNFNSHAHVERDAREFENPYDLQPFQLTRSRGA